MKTSPKPTPQMSVADSLRLLEKVKGYSYCWLWCGATDRLGYGRLRMGHTTFLVHRLSFTYFHFDPMGLTVHHRCGNTRCINPEHLDCVTNSWNVAEGNSRRKTSDCPF